MAAAPIIQVLPTMGRAADTQFRSKASHMPYRMLLNVVSRGGMLCRRPRIRAMDMGYSSSIGEGGSPAPEASDGLAHAPRWTIMGDPSSWVETATVADTDHMWFRPPGGLLITASNVSRYVTTANTKVYQINDGGAHLVRDVTGITVGTEGDFAGAVKLLLSGELTSPSQGERVYAIQMLTGASPTTFTGEHRQSRNVWAINGVMEGIDCEIIGNTVVALYLSKYVGLTTVSPTNTDLYFVHSLHHTGDPRFGKLQSQHKIGTIENDNIGSWYAASSYWKRRVFPSFSDYVIAGHGLGPEMAGATKPNYAHLSTGYYEHDIQGSAILFSGVDAQMLADVKSYRNLDTNLVSTIERADPFATIYCVHSPKNAFMYTERNSGQSIWYGFANGDDFLLNSEVPAVTAMLGVPEGDISSLRDTLLVRDYDLWFSEPMRPLSISFTGLNSVNSGSRAPAVVGLADYRNGTAIFTNDTVQFTRGIGADSGTNAATRAIIHNGLGSDSRWSIKSVGNGVAFLNKRGLWYLGEDGQVQELSAFQELFSHSGIDCSRGPYHSQITADVDGPDVGDELVSGSSADKAYNEFEHHPWRSFKVDQSRLDRAVAGVWDDLYLCFVSLDGDDIGNDNRLVLCWNWKENTFTTWLLPKDMGVRGWAYDGRLNTPYVMTRYGLARFEDCNQGDEIWYNEGPTDNDGTTPRTPGDIMMTSTTLPTSPGVGYETKIHPNSMPFMLGQTHWLPESGDAYVVPSVIMQHETKHDYVRSASWTRMNGGSVTYTGGDDDFKMKIRVWSQKSEAVMTEFVSEAHSGFMKMNLSNTEIKPLDNLVDESKFKVWRDHHCRDKAATAGISTNDNTAKFRVPNAIRRVSRARSGFQATRFAVQFSTSAPNKVLSFQVLPETTAPRGERG